jgi:hypothetical protein
MIWSSLFCAGSVEELEEQKSGVGDLETLVLEHTLDGSIFAAGGQLGLEDNTEGTVADNLALGVLHLFCLSGQAILDLFANYLCTASVRAKHGFGPMDGMG